MMSDDSENDGAYVESSSYENDIYYKKYKLLLEECEAIQRNNELLVYRINAVRRITKNRIDQITFIKERLLTVHGEDWTVIPNDDMSFEEEDSKPILPIYNQLKTEIKDIKQEIEDPQIPLSTPSSSGLAKLYVSSSVTHSPITSSGSQLASTIQNVQTALKKAPTKRSKGGSREARDPRAPKRPSNPFFQFCQEQRQVLLEQILSELKPGEVEPSKQELTRQLALKWRGLSVNEKKVYVDMYERSKEKYAAEMTEYNMKK